MRYLLDTHTFLWAYAQSDRLPKAIKIRSKRLDVGGKSSTELLHEAVKMGFVVLHLGAEEAASHQELLEDTHFDPFDRMLIWQAISRKMTLISGDRAFERFKADGLKLIWK